MKQYDPLVMGSDLPRSRKQYVVRRLSNLFVDILGLNKPNFLTTEIVQQINPVAKIFTKKGVMMCRVNHGRLLWRAKTFFTEEPDTIPWLESIKKNDVLWDVGANVGLYSIYAAKVNGCKVYAFEPEAQNYALLVENIALNNLGNLCFPVSIAINDKTGIGNLKIRYITKGGAFNLFQINEKSDNKDLPESIKSVMNNPNSVVQQLIFGMSLDDLLIKYKFTPPTHLKIDVDGIEPLIIKGALKLLKLKSLRSILIEINKKSKEDLQIIAVLKKEGFKLMSETSCWISKKERSRENEYPVFNMIFSR